MPPVAASAIAWLGGTLAVHALPALPDASACVPILLLVLLLLRARAWPVVAFLVAAAWTAGSAAARLDHRLPAAANGRDFAVEGWVASFPAATPGQATFAFAVAGPRPAGVPRNLRLTWYDPPVVPAPGDSLALTVRLRAPRGNVNPGGFDYERWLLVNDFGATGYVRAAAPAAPRRELAARWLEWRALLAERLVRFAADDDGATLLVALALGERYRFDEQQWLDFRRTGTTHLVAVSGMHVALLGLVVFVALRYLWLRLPAPLASYDLEAAASASLAATAYYAALTGFAVPAQRSLAMIAIGLAIVVGRRSLGLLQTLSATLLLVLVWDPFAPLTASFWLSFGAVVVLLALAAPRPIAAAGGRLRRAAAGLREFVGLQWRIGLALLPLTAWCFGAVSAFGPLANLVAIPWFNLVLMPAAVLDTVALSSASTAGLAAPLVHGSSALAGATTSALHRLAALPGAAFDVSAPPWPVFALAVCAVAFAVGAPPVRGRALAWLAVLPMFLPRLALPARGSARATVLDVGHGLAVIVETRAHRLLYDAGPAFGSGFDTGADIVLPALAAESRRGLDRLIVSHADNDHAGGVSAVARTFPNIDVLGGPDVALPAARRCIRGEHWIWDDVRFELLHPAAGFEPVGNESSCVLKITAAQGATLLLAGDIERRGEAALLSQDIAVDVAVVPHHGSATSSSAAFVDAVRADYAIVSAGFANRWGFPKPEVVTRWQRAGAQVVVTGDSGAVEVALDRDARVAAKRDGRHRYWQAPVRSGR